MKAVYIETLENLSPVAGPNGALVRAVILADETPASLTIDGSDVDGLSDDDVLAVGSVLITPTTNYIAFADGVFTVKGAGA